MDNYLQNAAFLEADGRRVDLPGIEMVEPDVNEEASPFIEDNQEIDVDNNFYGQPFGGYYDDYQDEDQYDFF